MLKRLMKMIMLQNPPCSLICNDNFLTLMSRHAICLVVTDQTGSNGSNKRRRNVKNHSFQAEFFKK